MPLLFWCINFVHVLASLRIEYQHWLCRLILQHLTCKLNLTIKLDRHKCLLRILRLTSQVLFKLLQGSCSLKYGKSAGLDLLTE